MTELKGVYFRQDTGTLSGKDELPVSGFKMASHGGSASFKLGRLKCYGTAQLWKIKALKNYTICWFKLGHKLDVYWLTIAIMVCLNQDR